MRVNHAVMDAAGSEGSPAGGAAAAAGAGGGAGGAAGAAGGASTVQPGQAGAVGGSVLGVGAAASAGAVVAAGADGKAGAAATTAQPGTTPGVEEKFLVKAADGQVDWAATAKKQAESYTQLQQRLGKGGAAPATPEDYKPEIPAGLSAETLAADPLYKSFLKGAHAKGMTNEHVGYVLNEFAQRQAMAAPSPDKAVTALREVWTTEADFNTNARHAFKAISEFGKDLSDAERKEIDSNPTMLRVLARIGSNLAEDTAPIMAGTPAAQTWDEQMAAIRAHPGFADARHPEHKQLMAKQTAMYQRRHGNKSPGLTLTK